MLVCELPQRLFGDNAHTIKNIAICDSAQCGFMLADATGSALGLVLDKERRMPKGAQPENDIIFTVSTVA